MVEGMRKETKKQSIAILLIFSTIISIYIIPIVIAPAVKPINEPTINSSLQQNFSIYMKSTTHTPHLLIFISPQYQNDEQIANSIYHYQQAVYDQPGWTSRVIKLTNETNQIEIIDTLIEHNAFEYNLSGVLLIGEDIALPIKNTYQSIKKPQLDIYSTINTRNNTQNTICVSLLFPNPIISYAEKQTELIIAINRFAQKRTIVLNKNSSIIEQSALSSYSKNDYTQLSKTMNADYKQDCSSEHLSSLIQTPSDMICFHGHGQPNQVILNSSTKLKISSDIASYLPTSILAIDGCYTDSFFTNQNNSNTPFISSICTSSSIHIGFFGLLSQQTQTEQGNVINSILSKITMKKTVAEVISQANVSFDFVFSGDPTVGFEF
jgi:hypothetical protein